MLKWLVINYNLPTEPTRYRVAIWRSLKKAGAVNVQQSMWVLPYNEENLDTLQKMSVDIEANNGEILLMESVFYDESHEKRVISLFNKVRDEEYTEFIDECGKYLLELKKEIKNEKFTFAELEEEEAELQKLVSWFDKINARDLFHSPQEVIAKEMIGKIELAFDNYSDLVYKNSESGNKNE